MPYAKTAAALLVSPVAFVVSVQELVDACLVGDDAAIGAFTIFAAAFLAAMVFTLLAAARGHLQRIR